MPALVSALFSAILALSTPNSSPLKVHIIDGQSVGKTARITADFDDVKGAEYRFEVIGADGATLVLRNFAEHSNSLNFTPMDPGRYTVRVAAQDTNGAPLGTRVLTFDVPPIEAPPDSIVPSTNSLIVFYAAPPCVGEILVKYWARDAAPRTSAPKPCSTVSEAVMIAGLVSETPYEFQRVDPMGRAIGPIAQFTTHGLPPYVVAVTAHGPPRPSDAMSYFLYSFDHQTPKSVTGHAEAVDSRGRIVWYFNEKLHGGFGAISRPIGNGLINVYASALERGVPNQIIRIVNLLGDTIRETTVADINRDLAERGLPLVTAVHHDSVLLPDGSLAVLASIEKPLIDPKTGKPADVLGDSIVVLDKNLHVTWIWSLFDHLDPFKDPPSLGDSCKTNIWSCLPGRYQGPYLDWSHANALDYFPDSGTFLLSLRATDQILDIAYRNPRVRGKVVWILGKRGDFTIESKDGDPWFSHQHGPQMFGDDLAVFDNGMVRATSDTRAHSRGQVFQINTARHVARLVLNYDLGRYAEGLGDAQHIGMCRYLFLVGQNDPEYGKIKEGVSLQLVDSSKKPYTYYSQTAGEFAYRGFEITDMFAKPTNAGFDDTRLCWRDDVFARPYDQPVTIGHAASDGFTDPAWHRWAIDGNLITRVTGPYPYAITYRNTTYGWVESGRSWWYYPKERVRVSSDAREGTTWHVALDCERGIHYQDIAVQRGKYADVLLGDVPKLIRCRLTHLGFSIPARAPKSGTIHLRSVAGVKASSF
jgi:hypothetical protein